MVSPKALALIPLLLACNTEPGAEPQPEPSGSEGFDDVQLQARDSIELLTRVSLDLRGVRPSVEEIARVEADEAELEVLIDGFLTDERFGDRVMALYSEILLTEADTYVYVDNTDFGVDSAPAFLEAVGQEPLQILAEVARQDLPWTEVVTADWTMANETVAALWPVDYPEGATGWQRVSYTDDRPAAGVLSTSGMWLRYTSTDSNANRKRANQVSRIFLCNDYLSREIDFDRDLDLLDSEAVEAAIKTNPSCANCHNSLDPLAAYLFGFWAYQPQSYVEVSTYHPDRERLWEDYLDVAPAFYGSPGTSLTDLGHQLAGDPRFPSCTVEQVYSLLLDREAELEDQGALTEHREAFLAGGLTMRSLVRSVVDDPRYRSADVPDADGKGGAPLKIASPELLASQVEGLTGYRWTYADYDMLGSDAVGLRTLAGGADGNTVVRNALAPNATILLVQERLAEHGAYHGIVTEAELDPAERTLFPYLEDFTETYEAEPDRIIEQLQHLNLVVLGKRVAADGPELEAQLELWQTIEAIEDSAPYAWWATLSALLRDPDFLLY